MITATPHNWDKKADVAQDCSLCNIFFIIAGIIGVATKRGYQWGFLPWVNQEYFVNPLPEISELPSGNYRLSDNYQGIDIGFRGFNIPDDVVISGYFGSLTYWEHCEDVVRHYLKMKDIAEPYEDCILIHYRNYKITDLAWARLNYEYYNKALAFFPDERIVVITDNIESAKKAIGLDCEYVSNSPIVDFYLLSHTRHLIMGNSSYSWMAAHLGQPDIVVAPVNWYAGPFWDCPSESNYLKNWIRC